MVFFAEYPVIIELADDAVGIPGDTCVFPWLSQSVRNNNTNVLRAANCNGFNAIRSKCSVFFACLEDQAANGHNMRCFDNRRI